MPLTVSVLHDDGVALMALAGELDLATCPRVAAVVDSVLADGLDCVLVDLDALTFCDSTGLGALLSASRVVTAAGGSFVLAGARGPVHKLLVLTHIEAALVLEAEVQPALQRLRQQHSSAG